MTTTNNETSELTTGRVNEIASMHARAEHWKSAFEFYEVELRFLRTLMDKYSIWLEDDEQVQNFISNENRLTMLDRKTKHMMKMVSMLLFNLSRQLQEPLLHEIEDCREAQFKIETLYTEFLKELLRLKKAIFDLTEAAIEHREQGDILQRR